ncbi:MAG TPA: helix-hairpin-helix domain-containing protein, partial [bacterium]|nr:helix-hairpin-helix domain-containing protein [bacterium]
GARPGELLRLTGRWVVHPKFGRQLQVESFLAASPTSLMGIERFLGSGLVEGIGKELAARLTRRFGMDTLKVIEESPGRLREVEGIGPMRAERIQQAWTRLRDVRNLMVFLQSCGLSTAMARRIHAQYGERAAQLIRQNPWRLASDVMGIGFATADSVARNLGVPADSPQRAEAGILHLMSQREEEGNVWVTVEQLQTQAAALLDLGTDACAAAIGSLVARGHLFEEPHLLEGGAAAGGQVSTGAAAGGQVALARLARAEVEVARRLALIARTPAPAQKGTPSASPDEAIARQERKSGIQLSAAQREAARAALTAKVLLITGGPGTGKTTLVRAIAGARSDDGARVELCAPTGRAARRLAEATGMDAKTIHRLLEFSPQKGAFLRNAENPLGCDALVVDE